jgi:hypothetical protein
MVPGGIEGEGQGADAVGDGVAGFEPVQTWSYSRQRLRSMSE